MTTSLYRTPVLTSSYSFVQAEAFYRFLLAYSCWLGPISGVCLAGYYVVYKQRLDVRQLYVHPGIYSFDTHGFNWRAYAAFLCGFGPNL